MGKFSSSMRDRGDDYYPGDFGRSDAEIDRLEARDLLCSRPYGWGDREDMPPVEEVLHDLQYGMILENLQTILDAAEQRSNEYCDEMDRRNAAKESAWCPANAVARDAGITVLRDACDDSGCDHDTNCGDADIVRILCWAPGANKRRTPPTVARVNRLASLQQMQDALIAAMITA